jgi:hypothetical protein
MKYFILNNFPGDKSGVPFDFRFAMHSSPPSISLCWHGVYPVKTVFIFQAEFSTDKNPPITKKNFTTFTL